MCKWLISRLITVNPGYFHSKKMCHGIPKRLGLVRRNGGGCLDCWIFGWGSAPKGRGVSSPPHYFGSYDVVGNECQVRGVRYQVRSLGWLCSVEWVEAK